MSAVAGAKWVDGVESRCSWLERRHHPWRSRSLVELLDDVASEYPDRPFVVTDDDTLSYAQLADWSRRLARGLVEEGVRPGEHVAIVLPNGTEFIALRFAVARAGAVAVPLNFLLKAEELGYVLRQSRAAVLVTMEDFRGFDAIASLDEVAPEWERPSAGDDTGELRLVVTVPRAGASSPRTNSLTLATLAREPAAALDDELARRSEAIDPRQPATIFYTSGTTAEPKGVLSTHDMELRSAYGSAYTRGFEDGRRILFSLPLHHVFAYVEGLLAAMFVAGCVVIQSSFDPKATLEAVQRHRPGEALFVPTMSLAVIEAARTGTYDLSSLHSVMSAAQSAPERLWTDLRELLGLEQLVTGYGMTETSAASTFTMPGDPIDILVSTVGRPKMGGSAGDPSMDGNLVEYKTVDADGDVLPHGHEGELVARGPIVSRSYYNRAEETAQVQLPGGWLRSGDLGYVRDDGYLVLTGRSKEQYKCGGELVAPAEVEVRLNRRPEVAQAYVVGVPDERMGEVGCAWIVPAAGGLPDTDDLLASLRGELARFKVPAYILFTFADELPLTASGKVQKFKLAIRARSELGL